MPTFTQDLIFDVFFIITKIVAYMQVEILAKLQNLTSQLSRLQKQLSFEQIQSKLLCRFLTIYTNLQRVRQQFKVLLDQCIKSLVIILSSTEYKRKGHIFPYFVHILKKYQNIFNIKVAWFSQCQILKRYQMNKKSEFYQKFDIKNITQREIQNCSAQKYSDILAMVAEYQIALPHPQCICCSFVFVKNFYISNYNPIFKEIICISQNQAFVEAIFQKYVCAVINAGGGVILVGAQKDNQGILPTGITLSENSIKAKQNELKSVLKSLKPQPSFSLHTVFFHNHPLQQDFHNQCNTICFRIKLIPSFYKNKKISTYYLWHQQKGYSGYYQIYKLNQQKTPMQIQYDKNTHYSPYIFIHQNYYKQKNQKKNAKNIHSRIKCQTFLKHNETGTKYLLKYQYSKIFQQSSQIIYKLQKDFSDQQMESKKQQIGSDWVGFKYAHRMIISIPYNKRERFQMQFVDGVKSRKYALQVQRPFNNTFSIKQRTIMYITFTQPYQTINAHINQCNNSKQKYITASIITCILKIEYSLGFTEEIKNQAQKIFKNKYPQCGYKKQERQCCYLYFDTDEHALYVYMYFQFIKLKATFVQEKYISKTKKQNISAG